MPTTAFVTVKCWNGEISTTRFNVQDIDAVRYPSVTTDIDEVKTAIASVSLGNVVQSGFTKTFPETAAEVTDKSAQRESKWLVRFRDTTQFLDAANTIANPGFNKVFSIEIAGADTSLLAAGSEKMDITTPGVGADFATAIEPNLRSPYNANATNPTVALLDVIHVGRNL